MERILAGGAPAYFPSGGPGCERHDVAVLSLI